MTKKSIPHPQDKNSEADAKRLAELSESLRKQFQDVLSEPIPERLKTLIDAMRAIEEDGEGKG